MSSGGEVQADDVVEVGRHFVGGEAQVGGADLDQLAAGPQPSQRQERVGSAADHQVDVRREVLQQERHAVAEVGPVDQVVVVEHQVDVVRCGREFVEHRGEDGLDRRLGRLQQREHVGSDAGHRCLQGGDHVGPERGGLAVALIEGEPRHRPVLRGRRGEPRGEQCRLAESSGRRDQGQPGVRPTAQAPAQSRAGDQTPPRPGDVELGLDQRVCQGSSPRGSRGGDAHEGRACGRMSATSLHCGTCLTPI